MPLPWIRLDTAMPDNPKILALAALGDRGLAAGFVWTCSLAYSGKHGLDGYIPQGALSRVNGKAPHAKLLVAHNLWLPDGSGGWKVNDYVEFNPSNEETQRRSQRARAAALVRWGKEPAS